MGDYVVSDDLIVVQGVEYGALIMVRCKNHLNLRWFTKNIAPLGSRRLYECAREGRYLCACTFRDLEPVPA